MLEENVLVAEGKPTVIATITVKMTGDGSVSTLQIDVSDGIPVEVGVEMLSIGPDGSVTRQSCGGTCKKSPAAIITSATPTQAGNVQGSVTDDFSEITCELSM